MLFDQKTNIDTGGAPLSLPVNYESKVIAPRNPTLNRGSKIEPKFTPSTFLKEMSLDTQQKLLNTREMYLPKIISLSDMSETSLQTTSKVDIDEPLFQPYPSDITFQKYEPFNTYEVPLLLRNNDKVARVVKVSQVDTPYFTIVAPSNAYQKVAPGVALVFRIQFKPEEQRDYAHEILVATEREKFLIPIRAIGARAILDFPDSITFPTTAVKKPFHVSPENGLLPVGESMQVTIDFNPIVNGEIKDELVIIYDTGEKVYVNVYGVAQDINVRLEKRSVHFENTYLEMINQRTVTLSNRSDQLVHFQWKQYATEREEEQQKLRQLHALSEEEVNALQKLNVNTNESPSAGPFDFGVLIQRTFINHRRQLTNESYLFTHPNFRIDPLEGDIWPGGNLDIQVLFKPNEAHKYEQTAWLDVVGREQRLPLTLTGDGDGAKLEASFQTLDIGCVYVGSTHLYEVVLANKGFIEARYHIRNSNSTFGSCFQFDPSSSTISIENYQAIQITFHSEQLGQFNEIFNVEIEGNPQKLPITISGQVIGPTFYFDQAQLKFGLVSYGFQTTLTCHLYNTSLVPMPFKLHIDQDKNKKVNLVSFDDDEDEEDEDIINNNEFQIRPSRGIIPPQSDTKIYVDFIPKSIQKYDTFLQVDVDGVGNNIFSLPITAKSTVPRITLHNDILDLGRTFLNHPNERYIRLQNSTSLPMRYQFLYPHSGYLHFQSNESEGVIDANTTRDIPLIITIKQLGDITEKIEIHRVGARDPPLELEITATGTGPVLFIDPNEIRFGTISVLDEHTQILSLSNESPIPAVFRCEFDKKNSCFSCIPNTGIVEPHTSMDVRVVAKLNDRLKFNEELIIYVDHSSPRTILVTAQGTGALIVPDIPIFPSLNLGSRFVGTSIVQRIHFTNKGRRQLAVHFIPAGDTTAAYGVQRKTKVNNNNNKETESNRSLEQAFRLEPERLEFAPGETRLLTVTGFAIQPKIVDEIFTCLAIIGRSTGRDKLLSLKIHCEFVEPLMSFSKTDLYFRVEYNEQTIIDGLRTPISSELTFSNISAIDLTANLRVKHPFLLKNDSNDDSSSTTPLDSTDETTPDIPPGFTLTKKIKILTGMSYSELIYFDPSANTKELSWKCDEQLVFTYEEHAFNDIINLHGEVHYPNLLIEHTDLDFGCILNGTEVTRYVTMVNVSPLPVKYLWAFILDENDRNYSFEPQPQTNITSPQLNQTQIQSGPWSETSEQQITYETANLTPKLEEIFDISPFFGCLQPGEIEKTAIRFYGHPGIKTAIKAICQIENGPVYELYLHGQASYMAYRLNTHELNFGDVHFDKSATHTLTLTNVGSVPLDFHFLNLINLNNIQQYAHIDVEPESGICQPYTSTIITIKFLPNIPEKFEKILYFQVAHFQPDEIHLIGTGMFNRLEINLPRFIINNSIEEQLYEQIKEKSDEKFLQNQLDKLIVQNFIQKSNDINPQFVESIEQSNLFQQQQQQSINLSNQSLSVSTTSLSKRSIISKTIPILPDYLVDFNYIILGTVRQQIIYIKNPTNNNITFRFDRLAYKNTGFSFDCDHIKNLPPGEIIPITITFDPRGANLELGSVECRVPVEVTSGPTFHLRLKAIVTMPDLNVSNDTLDFGTVKCGECKIATIQLRNPQEIRCEWIAAYPGEDSNGKQVGRFPRRGNTSANRRKPSTRIFEVLPPSGALLPGQKTNVQIKFTPTEETNYESRVLLRINQSSQRLMIICRGVGLEPQIIVGQMQGDIFEPTTSIVFNPILTHSQGDEQDIVIRNPCTFPVEIYNLEFDKQYLEEEKVNYFSIIYLIL
ncbi:unnamed protein product [Rotaria sp. Silwood1]|nr:unnamed protein product [Rotaria sp. Silwood1]